MAYRRPAQVLSRRGHPAPCITAADLLRDGLHQAPDTTSPSGRDAQGAELLWNARFQGVDEALEGGVDGYQCSPLRQVQPLGEGTT